MQVFSLLTKENENCYKYQSILSMVTAYVFMIFKKTIKIVYQALLKPIFKHFLSPFSSSSKPIIKNCT